MKNYAVIYSKEGPDGLFVTAALSKECALKTFRLRVGGSQTVLGIFPLMSFRRALKKFGNL